MSKCCKCGAPARHGPPDGDFKYDPPPRGFFLSNMEGELVRNIVLPMVQQRAREPGDAWDQAADVLIRISR